MDSRPDAAEEVHYIHGTGKSFSCKPEDLDEKAVEALHEITHKGIDGLEVQGHTFDMGPQHSPKGFFLSDGDSFAWTVISDLYCNERKGIWRSYGSVLGYGIGHHASGYKCFKRTFVYDEDNHKTNWVMVVYNLVHEYQYLKTDDVVLCHLFQSDNYDPSPKHVPDFFAFEAISLNSRVGELEDLMENPKAFKDLDEFTGWYSKCDSKWKAKGRNGKRGEVWEHFTPIKVIGPDGEVMLTLAICHGCSMAYQTGKWDPKRRKVTNNGTNTLKEHYRKCSDQHHIAGNPQGAHHQIP